MARRIARRMARRIAPQRRGPRLECRAFVNGELKREGVHHPVSVRRGRGTREKVGDEECLESAAKSSGSDANPWLDVQRCLCRLRSWLRLRAKYKEHDTRG